MKNLRVLTHEKVLRNTHLMYISTAHVAVKESQMEKSDLLKDYIQNRQQAELLFQNRPGASNRKLIVVRLGNTLGLSRQFELQGFRASGWKLVGNSMVRDAIFKSRITINDQDSLERTYISLTSASSQILNIILGVDDLLDTSTVRSVKGVKTRSLTDLASFIAQYSTFLTSKPTQVLSVNSTSLNTVSQQVINNTLVDSDDLSALRELMQWTVHNA